MTGVLIAALCVAFGVWWTREVGVRVDRYLALREQLAKTLPIPEDDPVPTDLLLGVQGQYAEPWAKDQAVEHLLELRAKLGSWQVVREIAGQGGV